MSDSKINDGNYYTIQGWMINRLGLKGTNLIVYAILYGFTQDGENEFTGSLQYLCEFCGGVSKPTVIKALNYLVDEKFIFKREIIVNGVKFVAYKISLHPLKKFEWGSKETLMGGLKNFNGGSKETLPNNKYYNKINNKEYNKNKSEPVENLFEAFWQAYPKKEKKKDAHTAFMKIKNIDEVITLILESIAKFKQTEKWKKNNGQFIPLPTTFLNGERWNDDIPNATIGYSYNGGNLDDLDDLF